MIGSSTYTREEITTLIEEQYNRDRDQQLWNTYRLSLERFETIFKRQEEKCACCGTTNPGEAPWHVDHDHETQEIRGILCLKCNTGIDFLGDNLKGVLQAVAYLRTHHDRGGHALAESPPPPRGAPAISAVMRRCFELFQQDVAKSHIVIILHLDPSLVSHLHDIWKEKYRENSPPLPQTKHVFQIAKEPFRCMCACGFTIVCDEKNADAVLEATVTVNAHVTKAADKQLNWKALKFEEDARREKEQQLQKEAARQNVLEDIRQREIQRALKQQDNRVRKGQREDREQHQETKRKWRDYGKS